MNLSQLELQRALKRLEGFCHQRNQAAVSGLRLQLYQAVDEFELHETAGVDPVHKSRAVLRLCFKDGRWFIYRPAAEGGWQVYTPCPVAESIESVMALLEQAPLHIHWG